MSDLEYRYAEPPPAGRVGGLAAPYERWETIGGGRDRAGRPRPRRREKIARGAFRDALGAVQEGKLEIKAFAAHMPERILGRTGNGTLQLFDAKDGLRFELLLPDTTDGRDMLALIQRGDLGASVGFLAPSAGAVASGKDAGDGTLWQVLKSIALREISLTASPAYKDTSVELLRSDAAEGRQPESYAVRYLRQVLGDDMPPAWSRREILDWIGGLK